MVGNIPRRIAAAIIATWCWLLQEARRLGSQNSEDGWENHVALTRYRDEVYARATRGSG